VKITEFKHYLDQYYFDKSVSYRIRIFSIILLTIGILLFWDPLHITIKLSLSLVFIGIFILFLIPTKSYQIDMEIRIVILLTTWLLFIFIITNDLNFDIFFFLLVLGMLTCKELSQVFLTPFLKKRLSLLCLIFFSLCMVLVAEKVISYFSI